MTLLKDFISIECRNKCNLNININSVNLHRMLITNRMQNCLSTSSFIIKVYLPFLFLLKTTCHPSWRVCFSKYLYLYSPLSNISGAFLEFCIAGCCCSPCKLDVPLHTLRQIYYCGCAKNVLTNVLYTFYMWFRHFLRPI